MSRRRWILVWLLFFAGLLWLPLIRPLGQAGVVLLDIYSRTYGERNLATLVAPAPRVTETTETFAGTPMRVTWLRPGWGDRHAAMMVVNGATAAGNDDAVTRPFVAALARAGYLVMLPEFPFLVAGRLETGATAQLDGAFALLRSLPEVERASAFGSSVGGGVLLAAAGREPALRHADALVILGAYFDLDTYLASVVTATQVRGGVRLRWEPSDEVRERLPRAAVEGMRGGDRDALDAALRGSGYDDVLARLRALPPPARASIDALSPRTVWARIAPPIFWLHDPGDRYEPLAEAERARDTERPGAFTLAEPGAISHAAPVAGPVGEIAGLLGFALEAIRATD